MRHDRGHETTTRTGPGGSAPGREGFALPVAIFALVIIGVLVTGGFFVARQESRIGVASRNATQAFYIAERGLAEILGDWHARPWIEMAVHHDSTLQGTVDGGRWRVVVTKTGQQTFFMDATGQVTEGGLLSGATRRVGVMTKLVVPEITPPAAITTRGTLTVGGSSTLSGYDTVPDGYTAEMCSTSTDEDKPGVMTADSVIVDGNNADLDGYPDSVTQDTTINDSTFTVFGEITYDDLVAMATYTLSPGYYDNSTVGPTLNSNGTCDTGNQYNWGSPLDPTHACADHHPVVHIAGDGLTEFKGGGSAGSEVQGQGILLIDGDLAISGRFVWNGIIIVQGSIDASGQGNKIYGGVYAGNASLAAESVSGNADVYASTCAVDRALEFNSSVSRARPLRERSWVDLSALNP